MLELDKFSISKRGYLGRCSVCKSCRNKDAVSYRLLNKVKNSNARKAHYLKNKDKYRERRRIWCNMKYNSDINFKIKVKCRSIVSTLIRYRGTRHTEDIIGCSYNEFKIYIESKFEPWMTWENHGKYNGELNYGWDIDHIIPLASITNEEEYNLVNHFSNLQPLCSKVNRDIKRDIIATHYQK